jgi:hypothetical protein
MAPASPGLTDCREREASPAGTVSWNSSPLRASAVHSTPGNPHHPGRSHLNRLASAFSPAFQRTFRTPDADPLRDGCSEALSFSATLKPTKHLQRASTHLPQYRHFDAHRVSRRASRTSLPKTLTVASSPGTPHHSRLARAGASPMHAIHIDHFWPEFDRVERRSYRAAMSSGCDSPRCSASSSCGNLNLRSP